MHNPTPMSRRAFIRLAGLAATALGARGGAAGWATPLFGNKARRPARTGQSVPDVELVLRAVTADVSVFPGARTHVWMYQGELLRGDPRSLHSDWLPPAGVPATRHALSLPFAAVGGQPEAGAALPAPRTYLGPIIRLRQGQRVRVHFVNQLPEASIIHWHGFHVPAEMDGHPRTAIAPGRTFVYDFEVKDRAGTYWYHPHPHMRTGPQVYQGLAGLLIVTDDEEAALELPSGEADIPLAIQDRGVDANNQWLYPAADMMGMMTGVLGDRVLVNGRPNYHLTLAPRAYRLRLLNGSNARIYKLAWSNGSPMTVIATDGGLLQRPVRRDYVMLGAGERIELLADFSDQAAGTRVELRSLAFSGAQIGMMDGMMGNTRLPNGSAFPVMSLDIADRPREPFRLPTTLAALPRNALADAVNAAQPRAYRLTMRQMNSWLINNRSFDMETVAPDEIVNLGDTEVWEIHNEFAAMGMGGMMGNMGMAHPMHVHGLQFQVLERQVQPSQSASWETVRHGYVDDGWKDTVLLMPGERAKLLLRFQDYSGLFMIHCHNLEHSDMGMMRNYLVRAPDQPLSAELQLPAAPLGPARSGWSSSCMGRR